MIQRVPKLPLLRHISYVSPVTINTRIHIRLIVGFLVLNCPRVDMVAAIVGYDQRVERRILRREINGQALAHMYISYFVAYAFERNHPKCNVDNRGSTRLRLG